MSPAIVFTVQIKPLRQSQSPDLPDVLLHMTGRNGRRAPGALPFVQEYDSVTRLANILWWRQVFAAPAFGSDWPVICFTQTTRRALAHLTTQAHPRYDGIGLAFRVQAVFDAGGGPALYVRGNEFDHWQGSSLPEPMKARAVRYWPGSTQESTDDFFSLANPVQSQWLHEREWRIPRPTADPPTWRWDFVPNDVAFLLLRDSGQHAQLFTTLGRWASQGPVPTDLSWAGGLPVAYLGGDAWTVAPEVAGWP
ncbi:MAG: hypothetical protein L0H79_06855 [Intrasporangium sp.]|uniref:hypothetical protein n=1 Tax=Intrasporangium sp. TaxID=1925024 RepID=UPI0026498B91|nr:hypothetical protein [Intrasporangium sp.]MDN5795457.1 hypothetical protein [Intrasporangium sp.]